MKNKFKNYLKLGILLFGISITLLNCQKDDSIINVDQNVEILNDGYSISIIDKEEVFQNKIIADKILPILKTKTTNNSNKVTNDEHGFTIHTDNVKYLEKDNYHSYTFYVERDYESNIIENLLLTLKDDGSYKPFLVQYNNENSQQLIDNNTTVNFIELEDNFDYNQLLTTSRDCYIISVKHQGTNDGDTYIDLNDCLQYNPGGCDALVTWGGDCAQQDHDNSFVNEETSPGGGDTADTTDDTDGNDNTNTSTDTSGPFSGISGTNTGTDGTSSTSGDETIDNTNNNEVIGNNDECLMVDLNGNCFDVVTSPIIVEIEPAIGDPCNQLNDIIDPNKANIKPKLEALKTTLAQAGENGVQFSNDSGTFTNTDLTPTATNSIDFAAGGNNYGGVHTHPTYATYPMFSWSDVNNLVRLYQLASNENKNKVTFMLVSSENSATAGEVYALKVDDFIAFRNRMTLDKTNIRAKKRNLNFGSTDDQLIDALNNELGTEYASDTNGEKAFLNYFNDFNISLYKANDDISNWNKLELQFDGSVAETPCN